MSEERPGVSFVVPVHNGERSLGRVLDAIIAQHDGRPMEIVAVDDGSADDSGTILGRYAAAGWLTVLTGPGRGAAAAINLGLRQIKHPIMCQVDQDVVIEPGWMTRLVAAFSTDDVAAAQGYYVAAPEATMWARVMGLDLQERYRGIHGRDVDHVCTGNSAYRVDALRRVGPFDETLGYGYDNDMSYRLGAAGYRLVFCRDAVSVHHWREGARAYLVQQYGVGYGRLDVIAKHRRHLGGDDVSGAGMILHAAGMCIALVMLGAGVLVRLAGGTGRSLALCAAGILVALVGERLAVGVGSAFRFGNRAGLFFVPAHLLRDMAWACAVLAWLARRLRGRPRRPQDSMRTPLGPRRSRTP
jgi:GT2 family glycosyltransferase